jgi:hypothetical protein
MDEINNNNNNNKTCKEIMLGKVICKAVVEPGWFREAL